MSSTLLLKRSRKSLKAEQNTDYVVVLVCDKQENGTFLKRLDKDTLEKWLEHYSLGDLWLMGEIGGT